MKANQVFSIILLVILLCPCDAVMRVKKRRQCVDQNPITLVQEEKEPEDQNIPSQIENKKIENYKVKSNLALIMFGLLATFGIGLLLFTRIERPSESTHVQTKHRKLHPDVKFYLQHGIHPSKVGVRFRKQFKNG